MSGLMCKLALMNYIIVQKKDGEEVKVFLCCFLLL